MPQTEYSAVKQLLQLQCHNCHTKVVIDPTDPAAAESIQDWLKVQKSNGDNFGYCSVECLQKGSHNLRQSAIITTE